MTVHIKRLGGFEFARVLVVSAFRNHLFVQYPDHTTEHHDMNDIITWSVVDVERFELVEVRPRPAITDKRQVVMR